MASDNRNYVTIFLATWRQGLPALRHYKTSFPSEAAQEASQRYEQAIEKADQNGVDRQPWHCALLVLKRRGSHRSVPAAALRPPSGAHVASDIGRAIRNRLYAAPTNKAARFVRATPLSAGVPEVADRLAQNRRSLRLARSCETCLAFADNLWRPILVPCWHGTVINPTWSCHFDLTCRHWPLILEAGRRTVGAQCACAPHRGGAGRWGERTVLCDRSWRFASTIDDGGDLAGTNMEKLSVMRLGGLVAVP